VQEGFQQAHLQLARIHESLGERVQARAIAQRLLDRWKDADPGLPLLVETRVPVERLDSSR
jgi:hypothetical protein